MEEHTQQLDVFCQSCGEQINAKDRKEDVAKCADEIKQIWEVSVVVDSLNVHPRFICMKCRVKCSEKNYLAGKYKSSQKGKLWYPHNDDCPTCKSQVARGRPSKRKRVELGKKKGKHQHGSDTESASEHEDDQMPPRVYCLSMDAIRDCITNITYTDQCAIFQDLCSIIPKAQLGLKRFIIWFLVTQRVVPSSILPAHSTLFGSSSQLMELAM